MSGARPGTKSQLNESVDIRRPGAPENRIEVAIVKADAGPSRPRTALAPAVARGVTREHHL